MKKMMGLVGILASAFACGDENSTSRADLEVRVYGEDYVEDRIPAEDTDGWEIAFSDFLIVISDVNGETGGEAFSDTSSYVVDLKASSGGLGHVMSSIESKTGAVDFLNYSVSPATDASVAAGVDAEELQFMAENGYSVWVMGQATKEGVVKSFEWGFDAETLYANCETTAVVGESPTTLTIHADHFFYDDFLSEPNVAFELVASADADEDGFVTRAELEALDISGESRYQVGSWPITNLWAFIDAQAKTLGHIDGEGHCDQN